MIKSLSRQHIIILGLALVLASSLFWSTWLIGLSVFLLMASACWNWMEWKADTSVPGRLKNIFSAPSYVLLILVWVAYLISGIIHQDWAASVALLQLKLPYLLLPIAFFLVRPLPEIWTRYFTFSFIAVATLFCLGVFINFLTDPAFYRDQMSYGKALPTPGSHIRFSLLVSMSILWGLATLIQSSEPISSKWRSFMIISIILQFAFLHFFAVKSGLLTTYLGLGHLLLWIFYNKKGTALVYITSAVVAFLPILTYLTIPTFHQKIHYVIHDWHQIGIQSEGVYSDAERWRSIEIGWEVFKSNPIAGTGAEQLVEVIKGSYQERGLSETVVKKPHNQFVYSLAQIGLAGGIFVIVGLILPFFLTGWRENLNLILTAVVFLTSCMVESTIETSAGMTMHLLFILIALAKEREHHSHSK